MLSKKRFWFAHIPFGIIIIIITPYKFFIFYALKERFWFAHISFGIIIITPYKFFISALTDGLS